METIKTWQERMKGSDKMVICYNTKQGEIRRRDEEIADLRAALAKRDESVELKHLRTRVADLERAAESSLIESQAEAAPVGADDGLISVDNFYADMVEDIAHTLAQELENAELNPDDLVTVNRTKLTAFSKRVIQKARAALAQRAGSGDGDMLRDVLAIQEACGLHTDEYAPGSVIEYIKELEADSKPATVQPDSGRDAALRNIAAAIEVNDSDTLSSLIPDSHVIWMAAGSWSGPAPVTLGDLRAIAAMAAQVKKGGDHG